MQVGWKLWSSSTQTSYSEGHIKIQCYEEGNFSDVNACLLSSFLLVFSAKMVHFLQERACKSKMRCVDLLLRLSLRKKPCKQFQWFPETAAVKGIQSQSNKGLAVLKCHNRKGRVNIEGSIMKTKKDTSILNQGNTLNIDSENLRGKMYKDVHNRNRLNMAKID